MYVYMYVYVYICIYIYMYIYMYTQVIYTWAIYIATCYVTFQLSGMGVHLSILAARLHSWLNFRLPYLFTGRHWEFLWARNLFPPVTEPFFWSTYLVGGPTNIFPRFPQGWFQLTHTQYVKYHVNISVYNICTMFAGVLVSHLVNLIEAPPQSPWSP